MTDQIITVLAIVGAEAIALGLCWLAACLWVKVSPR